MLGTLSCGWRPTCSPFLLTPSTQTHPCRTPEEHVRSHTGSMHLTTGMLRRCRSPRAQFSEKQGGRDPQLLHAVTITLWTVPGMKCMTPDSPASNDKQQDSVRDRCPGPRCSHQALAGMASGPSPLVPGSSGPQNHSLFLRP